MTLRGPLTCMKAGHFCSEMAISLAYTSYNESTWAKFTKSTVGNKKNGFPIDESTIGYAFFDGAYKLDEVMYRQVLSLREKRGNGDLSITVASFQ
mmetsp:Transcript_7407/g.9688  ORF Transcript_7407/g.9688 Transcript_7407/m.9688 type:complete len:95 (-) Transcript_7407:672-956(-)